MYKQLAEDFQQRVHSGFRPKTSAAYKASFRVYLAFTVHLRIQSINTVQAAPTLTNYLSVLKHYFAVFSLNVASLEHRLIKMTVRAVAYNASLAVRVKDIISVNNLKSLMLAADALSDSSVYKAVMLLGFFWLLPFVHISSRNRDCFFKWTFHDTQGRDLGTSWSSPGDKMHKKHAGIWTSTRWPNSQLKGQYCLPCYSSEANSVQQKGASKQTTIHSHHRRRLSHSHS